MELIMPKKLNQTEEPGLTLGFDRMGKNAGKVFERPNSIQHSFNSAIDAFNNKVSQEKQKTEGSRTSYTTSGTSGTSGSSSGTSYSGTSTGGSTSGGTTTTTG